MMPLFCTKCEKREIYNCTIPNVAASISYTIGCEESGTIGVDFFEKDSENIDGTGKKDMYLVPVNTKFKKTIVSDKEKLPPGSKLRNLPPITTNDKNLSIEILSLDYDNTPDSGDGIITINAIMGCSNMKKRYKVNLKATWDFEELQD